jgi:hypothetical protein
MYSPNEDVTSKYKHKIAVEFQMNDSVGRDSTMDPFANRDITKILGKPVRDRMAILFNTEKPTRHSPSMVDIQHGDNRAKSGFPQLKSTTPGPEYDIPSTLSATGTTISHAARWQGDRPLSVHVAKRDAAKDLRSTQLSETLQLQEQPASFTSWDASVPKLSALTSRGELFGAAPNGRPPVGGVSHALPANMPKAADRFTVFHWEQKKRLEKQAVELTAANDTARSKQTPHAESQTDIGNREEKWTAERKHLLTRMGIEGGSRAEASKRMHRKIVVAPSFSSMPGRNAPVPFHTRLQLTDTSYDPKKPARSRSAGLSFSKSSGRGASAKPYVDIANRCLEYTSLVKFHERQKIRARTSPFALPEQDTDNRQGKAEEEVELRVYDDLAMHPESLRQPTLVPSKKFKKAPDMALYCDRADATLQHVLGPNLKKYAVAAEEGSQKKKVSKQDGEGIPIVQVE